MSETTADVQNIFDSIAGRYDTINTILSLNIDQQWRKKAIQICNLKENQKVLDLCCGTGQMVYYECKAVGRNTRVTGLDFAEEMIRVGYKKLTKSVSDYKFKLEKGNVLKLPFEKNSFDCITIAFGLRNIPDKMKVLSEMYRVLKPGGKAVCLELSKPQVPVLKDVYSMYFNHVLPFVGYLGTGDRKAYRHLRDSVNGFLSKTELKSVFDNVGYKDTNFVSLTCGAAAIHYGIKRT
jgi:demethylmenaquinone methyltransferase/2-methoxy-6-polyprenyl-1,4-benzoquinol methylase